MSSTSIILAPLKSSGVSSSVVSGPGQVSTYALLQLNEVLLPQLSDPAVKARVQSDLETLLSETNRRIEHFEALQFLVVTSARWSIEDGQLTPTLKIKRSPIENMYASKLDAWYGSGEKVIWE